MGFLVIDLEGKLSACKSKMNVWLRTSGRNQALWSTIENVDKCEI
jgi:hypothetical protein